MPSEALPSMQSTIMAVLRFVPDGAQQAETCLTMRIERLSCPRQNGTLGSSRCPCRKRHLLPSIESVEHVAALDEVMLKVSCNRNVADKLRRQHGQVHQELLAFGSRQQLIKSSMDAPAWI